MKETTMMVASGKSERTIKVCFDDGDYMITRITADIDDIVKLYFNRPHIFGNGEEPEKEKHVRAVVFVHGAPRRKFGTNVYGRLRRLHSFTPAQMEKYGLIYPVSQTWHVRSLDGTLDDVRDYAYTDDYTVRIDN